MLRGVDWMSIDGLLYAHTLANRSQFAVSCRLTGLIPPWKPG